MLMMHPIAWAQLLNSQERALVVARMVTEQAGRIVAPLRLTISPLLLFSRNCCTCTAVFTDSKRFTPHGVALAGSILVVVTNPSSWVLSASLSDYYIVDTSTATPSTSYQN